MTLGPRSRNDLDHQYSHRSQQYYTPSFVEISSQFWKEDFWWFLSYMGLAFIFVMWQASYKEEIFISLYLQAYAQNLIQMAKWFLRKLILISHINDLGQRSWNALDLQHKFKWMSASIKIQVTGWSSFWKRTVFTFFLCCKIVMVNPGSSFEQAMMDRSPQWYITKSCGNGSNGSGEDFWRLFTIYGGDGPTWSCDPDSAYKILFPLPKETPYEIWLRLA